MEQKQILIVDPDPNVSGLLRLILEKEGHQITAARSLTEAVTLLSKSSFDLILTEAFQQHDEFVFDAAFLAELRTAGDPTPIVLLSTCVALAGVCWGDFGLAEVVPKPFDLDRLIRVVDRILA